MLSDRFDSDVVFQTSPNIFGFSFSYSFRLNQINVLQTTDLQEQEYRKRSWFRKLKKEQTKIEKTEEIRRISYSVEFFETERKVMRKFWKPGRRKAAGESRPRRRNCVASGQFLLSTDANTAARKSQSHPSRGSHKSPPK